MGRSAERLGDPGLGADVTRSSEVLAQLGLPTDDELLELVELGVESAAAARQHDSPGLLADYLDFARRRLATLGAGSFSDDQMRDLARLLTAGHRAGQSADDELVDRAVVHAPDPAPGDSPVGPLAHHYLHHVLAGDSEAAIAVVVDSALAGMPVPVLLTDVLETAQREIGRRWEDGEVTVAQEHFCTAVTQLALAALHPYLFDLHAPRRPRRRLVAAQPGGGLHQVGLRMVVDLLEHAGWDTTYLGAEEDPRRVVDALADRDAEVLALSAALPAEVAHVADLVRAVRADPRTSRVRIIVGGRAFLVAPELAERVGADGLARSAREAVVLCAQGDDVAV